MRLRLKLVTHRARSSKTGSVARARALFGTRTDVCLRLDVHVRVFDRAKFTCGSAGSLWPDGRITNVCLRFGVRACLEPGSGVSSPFGKLEEAENVCTFQLFLRAASKPYVAVRTG